MRVISGPTTSRRETGSASIAESIDLLSSQNQSARTLFYGGFGLVTGAHRPVGVFSHHTALSLHELSDVNPSKLEITVPSSFRRGVAIPKVLLEVVRLRRTPFVVGAR
jgi:hypothetical protein